MKSTIYLIRHGITDGNKRRLYYGSTDLPLAPEGIAALKERCEAEYTPINTAFALSQAPFAAHSKLFLKYTERSRMLLISALTK